MKRRNLLISELLFIQEVIRHWSVSFLIQYMLFSHRTRTQITYTPTGKVLVEPKHFHPYRQSSSIKNGGKKNFLLWHHIQVFIITYPAKTTTDIKIHLLCSMLLVGCQAIINSCFITMTVCLQILSLRSYCCLYYRNCQLI